MYVILVKRCTFRQIAWLGHEIQHSIHCPSCLAGSSALQVYWYFTPRPACLISKTYDCKSRNTALKDGKREVVSFRKLVLCGGAGQVSKAFCCLADDHPAAQQACASAIPAVISFLSHTNAAVKDQACQALACLTCNCHHNQTTAGQHGAVELLLHLLCTPCESQQQQQEVVRLLLAPLVLAVQVRKS